MFNGKIFCYICVVCLTDSVCVVGVLDWEKDIIRVSRRPFGSLSIETPSLSKFGGTVT